MTAEAAGAVPDDVIEEVAAELHLAVFGFGVAASWRDVVERIFSVPSVAEVFARDAKVREMWPVVDRLEDHWCECPLPPDAGCSRCHDFFHARSTIAALYPEAGK